MATYTPINRLDGDGTKRPIQTAQLPSGQFLDTIAIGDPTVGLQAAQVADHKPDALSLSGMFSLLVGALHKLKGVDGTSYDTARTGANDGGSSIGIPASGAMLLQPVTTTVTTPVAALSASATLSTASTPASFVPGAQLVLEPGTSRAETAIITAVITNTSIAIRFGSSGALYTHTNPYTVMVGLMNAQRQAPGAVGVLAVSSDGAKPTYRTGAVAQTLFSTSAAVLVEIQGSAAFTIRVKKITIWAQAATKFYAELTLLRCTGVSAGTPAASITTGVGKHDSADANGPATINYYTAAAAAGAGAVVSGAKPLSTVIPSATCPMIATEFNFCENADKAMILRGTGDVLEVMNNTTGLGSGTYGWQIEYEADLS